MARKTKKGAHYEVEKDIRFIYSYPLNSREAVALVVRWGILWATAS